MRPQHFPRDFLVFLIATALYTFSMGAVNSVFNNFLNDTYSITDFQRGLLELPRELPGFLVVFVSALLYLMSSRGLAALANLLAGVGIAGIALFSAHYGLMLAWLFLFSVGQHLFFPLVQSIAMEFAVDGKAGSRLGQVNGASNLAGIAGSLLILIGFRSLGFGFRTSFLIACAGLLLAALLLRRLLTWEPWEGSHALPRWFAPSKARRLPTRPEPDRQAPPRTRFIVRREYKLFYWLNVLYGTRKQIFLTFSPWVLVRIFKQPTETVASLLFVGGLIGIVFNPLLGRAIDRLGERFILMTEAAVLIWVCLGYGFSLRLFREHTAMLVVWACFVLDQMLMSVSMARATYLRKIAVQPGDVSQTLMMGVSIDHVFSIVVATLGGIIWLRLGYEYVFLLGALIAGVNLVSASRIRLAS